MEKLVVVRTNPTQGQGVKVSFIGENKDSVHYGSGEFPFPLWLQFEKLIRDGMEARARMETQDQRRIVVEFRPMPEAEVPEISGESAKSLRKSPSTLGGISNFIRGEEKA